MSDHVQELRALADEFDRIPFANPGDVLADRLRAFADRWEREAALLEMGNSINKAEDALAARPAPQASDESSAAETLYRSIVERTAKALGKPAEGTGSSWHDIPECVARLRAAALAMLDAVETVDADGELDGRIDGTLIDNLRDALAAQEREEEKGAMGKEVSL